MERIVELDQILGYWWVAVLLLIVIFYRFVARLFGIVLIPEDKMGLVNKKFKLGANSQLPANRIIALNGEAGFQAGTLPPGLHLWYWPWQYDVEIVPFTVIPVGKIGLVSAKDGAPLEQNRILGKFVQCNDFQDAAAFITNNGQKGRQSRVLMSGTYRINTLLFDLSTVDITQIPKDKVGIVTTNDGSSLMNDDIAGRIVTGHNSFQDFDAFLQNGGQRGLQQEVLLAGSWNLNSWAVAVEFREMLTIPIGYVGVVNSFVGEAGKDVTGESFAHGNIVSKGQKGVWRETLDPGKYAFNMLIMSAEIVPTTNIVLNWAASRTESHKLDENLSTISVRSKDGFKFNLDVAQIIHVPSLEAPKVIARFGNMKNLVSQVLEPTIGNYFRNSAQSSDVISFLAERSLRQQEAKEHIQKVLVDYNVKAVDTLIGDIVPPDDLMKTLTDRKLANERRTTYESQKMAEESRQNLEEKKALADIQPKMVEAKQGIEIAQNKATAAVKEAEGISSARAKVAEGEASAITAIGKAEGDKVLYFGKATAESYELAVKAMGQDNFTRQLVTKLISENKLKVVPDVLVSGGANGDISSNGLLSLILANQLSHSASSKEKK